MIFAEASVGAWIVFFIFLMFAMKGAGKAFSMFDKGGTVHGAAQKGVVSFIERLFKR